MEIILDKSHKIITKHDNIIHIKLNIIENMKRSNILDNVNIYFQKTVENLRYISKIFKDIKIINIDSSNLSIVYSMPYYKSTLFNLKESLTDFDSKIAKLFDILIQNKLVHNDISLQNIAVDEYNELSWLDLDSIEYMDNDEQLNTILSKELLNITIKYDLLCFKNINYIDIYE